MNNIFKDGLDPEIVARLISFMITYKIDGSIALPHQWDMIAAANTRNMSIENNIPLPWDGSIFVKTIRTMVKI